MKSKIASRFNDFSLAFQRTVSNGKDKRASRQRRLINFEVNILRAMNYTAKFKIAADAA